MSDLFDRIAPRLLNVEGGYVNDPRDSGGETNHGVTIAVARAHGYLGPMRDLTRAQALAIYRSAFWQRPGLHLVAPLSEKIAEELFDTGVNMGVGAAGTFLQRALNALNRNGTDYADLKVDGAIGPITAKALAAFLKKRGRDGEKVMLRALDSLQGAAYIQLAEQREKDEAFTFGWLLHRVGNVAA